MVEVAFQAQLVSHAMARLSGLFDTPVQVAVAYQSRLVVLASPSDFAYLAPLPRA
jgi:hypothetical protein